MTTRLTGNDLLTALTAMTDEQLACPVVIEGCDCEAYAGSVEHDTVNHYPRAISDDIPMVKPHIYIGRQLER